MRIAILGNSGSGKSTLARRLSVSAMATTAARAEVLDLDTVAWEPGQIAVPRPAEDAAADVRSFCERGDSWVVEGCYAGLVEVALAFRPRLLLLDPGEARCIEHCRQRPWEPHKYASKQAQDERLEALLSWVRAYYTRDGDMSLAGHMRCFESYDGPKEIVSDAMQLSSSLLEPRADPIRD
jgi:adenylate kinase family enzyme